MFEPGRGGVKGFVEEFVDTLFLRCAAREKGVEFLSKISEIVLSEYHKCLVRKSRIVPGFYQ